MPVNIEQLCIDSNASLLDAMILLDQNGLGITFVTHKDKFFGTLSDGDIRRALISGAQKEENLKDYCNQKACSLSIDTPEIEIQKHLSEKIKLIPLLDKNNHIIDFASIFRLRRIPIMEPLLGGNELEYVTDCIKTNWISSQGSYVTRFQEMLNSTCKGNYCLATSNGTTALHLALESLNIGVGDEVIVPNLTFGASVNAIVHANATPVLVDVDKDTWNISPDAIEKAITENTKAIMPVHLYGIPCDMAAIMKIAEKHNLLVIEDCAEALGATINNRPVGSFGDAAAFSFFANKVITCGEGGAVIFKDKSTYEYAEVLRDHGMSKSKKYWHEHVGYNYRLTNIQAAIGCAQLEQLEEFRTRRMMIFKLYDELLLPTGLFEKQTLPKDYQESYWLYTLSIASNLDICRDDLIEKLSLEGIDTRPVFYPMNEMPAYTSLINDLAPLANSENISKRGLSLPSSADMQKNDVRSICNSLISVVQTLAKESNSQTEDPENESI